MKTTYIILITLILNLPLHSSLRSKDYSKKLERAEVLFQGGHYSDALRAYHELYLKDSSDAMVCYRLGSCLLKTGGESARAANYLHKAVALSKRSRKAEAAMSPLVFRLLGDAYHQNSEFDEAIISYHQYKLAMKDKAGADEAIAEADKRIRKCNTAKELKRAPLNVYVQNLDERINSDYPDYCPRISADECVMIFTSKRAGNTGGKTYDGGQYFEDIYISVRPDKNSPWGKAENLGWPINTVGNEAAVALSADAQEIIIYKDDLGDGNLYSSKLNGRTWSTPKKLNANINSRYWEPCAYVSADRRVMYFVSDRPGGYGGTDLYRSVRGINGDWGPAENLGPHINTPEDEYSPFIHPDGKTLYFSSRGHNTMGGYDVFFSSLTDEDLQTWSRPKNIGYPINTPGDDVFYMVSADHQSAYYTSSKEGGLGEKDLYHIAFPKRDEGPSLSLLKGTVYAGNEKVAGNVRITVMDDESGEVSGVYEANAESGKYMLVLAPGRHNITYEADGHAFHSERVTVFKKDKYSEQEKHVQLPPINKGMRILLNNVFFETDLARLTASSRAELNSVVRLMKLNPGISVEVGGFADSRGSDEYNRKLSVQRAKAVVEYLVSKGIDQKRLTATGYGKAALHSGRREDSKNKVSVKATDRRVELKIVAMN